MTGSLELPIMIQAMAQSICNNACGQTAAFARDSVPGSMETKCCVSELYGCVLNGVSP